MRADVASYQLERARRLDEALARVAEGFRPLAGGTDVMVLFAAGKLAERRWVDVWGVPELRGIELLPDAVTLGALTTYSEVQSHPILRAEFPMLVTAASETGGRAIQNRGTLGGNIANASPAADSPPALLAYGAELELVSAAGGVRRVTYDGFHVGYKQTVMRPDEMIWRIRLPRPRGPRLELYRKVGPRRAQAIAKVCFAGCADAAGVRIALGGVAPIAPRCRETERAVLARDAAAARAALQREIAPIDDVRSTARYRRRVAENLLLEFLRRMP